MTLLQFLTFCDILSIAVTHITIYHLFSTANYVLKVKLCLYQFSTITQIYFTSVFFKTRFSSMPALSLKHAINRHKAELTERGQVGN